MRFSRVGRLALALGAAGLSADLTALARPADGAGPDPRLVEARELFAAAERDEDAGRWGEALEKLRRVAEVKWTAGVRFHEALCEEHLGHLTRALTDYTAAEDQARSENAQDVLRPVGKRLADLEPRVPRITLRLAHDAPDVTVKLDGDVLPSEQVGVPMAIDPGDHVVETTSPNRYPSAKRITVHERDALVIDVMPGEPLAPPRVDHPTPTPTPAPTPAVASAGAWPLGLSLGAGVLAGVGVGSFVEAGQARTDGRAACARMPSCDAQRNAVRAWDWVAASAWAGAAAGATVAVVLWTRRGRQTERADVRVGAGLVTVGGTF